MTHTTLSTVPEPDVVVGHDFRNREKHQRKDPRHRCREIRPLARAAELAGGHLSAAAVVGSTQFGGRRPSRPPAPARLSEPWLCASAARAGARVEAVAPRLGRARLDVDVVRARRVCWTADSEQALAELALGIGVVQVVATLITRLCLPRGAVISLLLARGLLQVLPSINASASAPVCSLGCRWPRRGDRAPEDPARRLLMLGTTTCTTDRRAPGRSAPRFPNRPFRRYA
jgi:hypothetical protein